MSRTVFTGYSKYIVSESFVPYTTQVSVVEDKSSDNHTKLGLSLNLSSRANWFHIYSKSFLPLAGRELQPAVRAINKFTPLIA